MSANKKSTENIDDVENNNNNNNEDDSPAKLQLKYRLLKEPRVLKLEGATPVASKVLQPAGGSTGSTTGSLIRPTTATTTLFHHPDYRSLEAEPARGLATSFHPLLDYRTGRIQYSYSPVADIRSIPYLPYYDPSPQGIPYHHPQYYIPVQQHHIVSIKKYSSIYGKKFQKDLNNRSPL